MKKPLLFALSLLGSAAASQAQITLNAATHMPQADTVYYMSFIDTSANPMMPTTGASVNWNYTTVVASGPTPLSYFGCIPQADCPSYSNADLINGSPADSSFQYFKTGTTTFQNTGTSAPDLSVKFTNALDVYRFPLTYNTQYADAASGTATTSQAPFPLTMNASDSVLGAGYGSLTTPVSTYSNVLLVRSNVRIKATLFLQPLFETHVVRYEWFETASRYPVMSINYTYSIDSNGGETLAGVAGSYFDPNATAVSTVSAVENFRLAPNPSTGNTRVEIPASFNSREGSIVVTDLTGKAVFSQSLNGATSVQISTEGWAKGLYLVRLQNAEGKMLMNKLSVQ